MKNQFKSLLLVAIFACTTLSAWSQASTQGKEFWVSSSLVCSPDKATPTPYIAVSAEKACTVTIQGGVGNAISIVQNVAAGSWNEFGNNSKPEQKNPQAGLINVHMDASKWYPTAMNDANNVSTLAAQKNMYGLHVTATENVSVYVILSSQHSMDASNILPMTALGSEYYTQDYWSKVKSGFDNAVGLTTILGTEDNTQIDITPNGDTFDGWVSGSTHQITLNKGQTYYLVTKKSDRLAGTHIMAKNGKKIAVYCGVPITNIPTGIAARDCLFEQSMPVEYWGTQFIVTRSLEKNGNLIGITATQNNTKIKVDGYQQASINEGDTYYIMLQGQGDPNAKNPGEQPIDLVLTQDAAYIETSCPCAVYSYDTGNSYKGNAGDEIVNGQGDPSSVWVSPIQQKIGKITFGTCYTSKTKDHFLNVVTETATCQNTKLTAIYGATQLDKSALLTWQPVPGNPIYSYARAKIGDANTSQFSVFRLENAKGFIATIYGNGEDESYAYSAGSAAVEMGINVNGVTFTDGYRSDEKFCIADSVAFDAAIGTDEIKRVDWEFGDGTTLLNGPVQTMHQYAAPGWYDVTATLFGRQVCTDDPEVELGTVSFTFRVWRPDTVIGGAVHECITLAEWEADPVGSAEKLANGANDTLPQINCYDDVVINLVNYGKETVDTLDTIVGQDVAIGYNGQTYYDDANVEDTLINEYRCNHYRRYFVHVKHCLSMTVNSANLHACPTGGDDGDIYLTYDKPKGEIAVAYFEVPNLIEKTLVTVEPLDIVLPTRSITMPGNYHGTLTVEDDNDCDPKVFPIDFTINYPSDIFKYKFNNVLAVYKSGFGGNTGFTFTAYQWYCNGQPIPGATEAVYHTDSAFNYNDIYYVELTTPDGVTIPSCAQHIESVPDYTPQPAPAPAKKMIVNRQMVIQRGEEIYDIYGQRIQ